MMGQKLKVLTNIKIEKEKQDNCNYILQNYFAFMIIKKFFRQNVQMNYLNYSRN